MHRVVAKSWGILPVVVFLCWLSTASYAQYHVNGTISGTVTDPSGAAIPSAKVTAANTQAGTSQSTTTTPQGTYLFSDMPPANYTITVEKEGFQACAGHGLVLDPSSSRTFSCALNVGATTEVVQVQAGALQVEADTAQINSVINSQQIEQLPTNGRNFANFLALQPGVAGINFSDFNSMNIFATQGVSVNGLRDSDNNILIEGVSSQRTRDNAAETASPAMDAIGEMNIVSSGYMPEYSRGAGAQIVVQLKSGTNQYHGSLYEYNQNTAYDSAENHLPGLTNKGPNAVPVGVINWNNFGGTFGGPIPKMHNKLFFFYSEDVTREPGASTNNVVVPSLLAHQGNFSEYCAAAIACPTVPAWLNGQVDPTSGQTLVTGKPFPNDTIASKFWSPNGGALMALYPHPNLSNSVASGLSNFFYLSSNPNTNHTESLKVDYVIDPWKSHLAVSLRHYRTDSFSGNFGGSPQVLNWNIQEPERGATIDLATTFSPTLLNDLTVGSTEDIVHVVVPPGPLANGDNRASLGINFPYIFGNASKDVAGKTPTINWSGPNSNFDSLNGNTDAYPSHSVGHIYQFSDVITKVHGHHTFKFGAWIEHDGENDDDQLVIGGQNLNGTFKVGAANDPHSTGLPVADLLLGVFDNYAEYGFRNETPWSAWQEGLFGQDSWKVNSKLTIEGGLRWDYFPNYSSKWCNFAMFNPLAYSTLPGTQQVIDPATGLVEGGNYYNGLAMPCNGVPSSAAGHVGIFGEPFNASDASTINQQLIAHGVIHGYSSTVVPNRYRAFQPRLGFAFDPIGNGKTSIRGSAGIFYNHETLSDQIQMGRNLPFQTGASINNGDVDCPGVAQSTTSNVFGCSGGGGTFTPGPVSPSATNPVAPIPVTGLDYRSPLPVVYSYHFSVQHMFPQNTLIEVGYVGTSSRHFSLLEDLNELPPGTFGNCTGFAPGACPYRFNSATTQIASIVPYAGFSNNSFTYQTNNGNSAYNSLQISVQRRMSNNVMFTGVYTYANAYDVGSELQSSIINHYNPNYNVGNPDWLEHHNFTATYVYSLPYFKNQSNFEGRVLGGWELSGVVTIHSGALNDSNGTFGTVTDQGADLAGTGYDPSGGTSYGEHADIVPGCNPNGGPRTYLKFINTTCFAQPAPGTLGNAPRNDVFGPRFWIWDAGLHKNGNLAKEKLQYQFRAEAVNVLNHPIPNGVNTNITSPAFGQINSLYGPNGDQRSLQLGLRLLF